MKQTLVALFDSFDDAAHAVERLLSQVSTCRSAIHVYIGDRKSVVIDEHAENTTSAGGPTANPKTGTGAAGAVCAGSMMCLLPPGNLLSAFEHLQDVARLSDEIGHYQEAIRRGHALLAIEAANETEIAHVTAVLHHFPTIDIDERVSQWSRWGYVSYDFGARPCTAEQVNADRHAFPVAKLEGSKGAQDNWSTRGVRMYPHRRHSPVQQVSGATEVTFVGPYIA